MIEHGSFLRQHQIMLTNTGKTQIKNVATGPGTGASDLDVAVATLDA